MSLIFWGLTTTMIAVAVATVVTPIRVRSAAGNTTTAALAIAVSLLAIGLYAVLGSPPAMTTENGGSQHDRAAPHASSERNSAASVGSVASLLDGLESRLEKEPDDADGWILLARSYEYLGRHEEAAAAYNRATKLGKTDARLERTIISDGLSVEESAADQGPAIRGRISLTPEATELVRPGDTVFVFVKADLRQPMPLLAVRKTVADLPLDYVLTDDMAMMPGTSLADFDQVVVTARVSRSGRAKEVLDGLEASSGPVSPLGDDYIELQIAPVSVSVPDAGGVRK
jgi:cytochrome c-type biogenesis protein CcmH